MRADYFNERDQMAVLSLIKSVIPNIDVLWRTDSISEAHNTALQITKKYTQRNKILVLVDPKHANHYVEINKEKNIEIIPAGCTALLCETIATSTERLAAIIVKYNHDVPLYYKKVRELASAEGALMLWDALDNEFNQFKAEVKISKNSQPDIICFRFTSNEALAWIGSRKGLMHYCFT